VKVQPKDIASRFVEILIGELNLPEARPIGNEVLLDDLGIDSLMLLTIGTRIRVELSREIGIDGLLKHRIVGSTGLTNVLEHRMIAARRAHSSSDDPNCS
jgi:acyl carrier protein